MSLSFKNFEDTFSVPRKTFEADVADEVKDELATFTIPFGQLLFDIYYGCRQQPTGSPMIVARWDRRRQQLSEELKAESFTLPVDWAKDLYEQLSTPEEWSKTLIYPKLTYKDGTEKELQLNSVGAGLFTRGMEKLVNQLLDYFEPKAVDSSEPAVPHQHNGDCDGYILIQ